MAQRNSIKLSKLDAARRQIETAISLWFADGDPVAIHTLTAAGHQVCHAITKDRKEQVSTLFNFTWLKPEHHKHYRAFLVRPENFFKHASSDPDPAAEIDFDSHMTEVYLFDACRPYCHLNGTKTSLMMAFEFRFQLFHPELVLGKEMVAVLSEPLSVDLRSLGKADFLEAFGEVLGALKEI